MCNCLQDSEAKMLEYFKENKPDKFDTISSGKYTNSHWPFSVSGGIKGRQLHNNFELKGTSTSKKGVTRDVKEEISITPSHCCFCGEPFVKEEKTEA